MSTTFEFEGNASKVVAEIRKIDRAMNNSKKTAADAKKGMEGVGNAIAGIASSGGTAESAIQGVSSALGAIPGTVGLIAGGIGALAGSIIGVITANQKAREEAAKAIAQAKVQEFRDKYITGQTISQQALGIGRAGDIDKIQQYAEDVAHNRFAEAIEARDKMKDLSLEEFAALDIEAQKIKSQTGQRDIASELVGVLEAGGRDLSVGEANVILSKFQKKYGNKTGAELAKISAGQQITPEDFMAGMNTLQSRDSMLTPHLAGESMVEMFEKGRNMNISPAMIMQGIQSGNIEQLLAPLSPEKKRKTADELQRNDLIIRQNELKIREAELKEGGLTNEEKKELKNNEQLIKDLTKTLEKLNLKMDIDARRKQQLGAE